MTVGSAFGHILPLAVGIALSPLAIVAVFMMLFGPLGRAGGVAFLAGWVGGLLVVGGVAIAISDAAEAAGAGGDESNLAGLMKLVLGLLLLLLAGRSWRSRPAPGEQPELPKWMNALDRLTVPKALGLGALFSSVKLKNLVLLLAAVATISASPASGAQEVALLVAFTTVASLTIAAPVIIHVALGARAEDVLSPAKDWMARNNSTVMAAILVIFGATLIGDAIGILSS
jgi:hypothetical protein